MIRRETMFPEFLAHGGEMGKLIREFDWSATPLGIPENWPTALKTSLRLCLDSLFPMVLWIGPEFRLIYNDAWRPALGTTKHPHALGQPANKVWPEIWETIGPMLNNVLKTGEPTWENNQLLLIERHGYIEETYWTYSYSPVRDDEGAILAVFAVVKETTIEVINDRHLRMLRDMGQHIVDVKNVDEVYEKCLAIIGKNNIDFPFTLFYRINENNTGARLIGSTGIDKASLSKAPFTLSFEPGQLGSRNFLKCIGTKAPVMVHDLKSRLGEMPGGIWKTSPEEGILLPITLPGAERPKVIIIAGVNPHKKLTPEYASFYELVADQITTEIVKIKSFEEARIQALKIAEIHRANEKNFRQMADSIPQMVWVTDPDGNAYFHNQQWNIYTGLTSEELLNGGWQNALHADDLVAIKSKWQEAYVKKNVFETEYRLKGTDGIYRWFLARAVPVFNDQGNITKWYGTTTNIHEKRKLEEKILESENILRKLVDHSPSAIIILSGPQLIVEQANIKSYQLLNKIPAEIIGKSVVDLFPAISEKGLDKILLTCMETGEPYYNHEFEVDLSNYGKTGTAFFTYLYQPLLNSEGLTDKIMVVSTEITSQVQLRKNIESSELKYRSLIQGLPAAVYTCDNKGNILLYNQAALELWGGQPPSGPDALHSTWKIFDKDGNPLKKEDCPVALTLTGETMPRTEIIIERQDGSRRNIIFHPQPIFDESGNIDGAVNMLLDITEQKNAQRALIESEKKLRLLSDAVPQLVWIADNNGEVKYYNNRINEYLYGDKIGYEWESMIHPDDFKPSLMAWFDSVKKGVPYQKEHRLKMKDGSYQWHLSRAYPEMEKGGQSIQWFGTATNIHEFKVSEEKIKESNSRLRLALESTHMGTWDYNPITDELDLSDRTREIFGFNEFEKIGMMSLYDTIIAKDRAHVITAIQYALQLDSGGNLDLQFCIIDASTGKEKVLKVNGKTFFDERGNAYRFVGTVLDITEQKKFSEELESRIALRTQELKVANDELMQINNKLEKSNRELESFTYIASHDLQEPLRKILFFSDFIQKNSNSLNGMESYFNKISVSTQRMSDLITSLLQYSTISNSQESFVSVDLNTILQNVYEDYEILIQETGAIISTDPLPTIFGNNLQMFQLFANLISNALKFSDKKPEIKINYRLVKNQITEDSINNPCHVYHEISIADNGIGIDQQYNDQIFIIFQRLHGRKDFPGMGLGLAICKKILENHHGNIRVSSIPGKGSEFIVSLPA